MLEIRDQTKITFLQNAWYNCGVLNTATTGDIDCLPISDVRNVENINYAFAVDDIFEGKKSYIDTVASMETVDPSIVQNAVGTFENNQFEGTSKGASGEENKTNLKTMFANNVDLTVNGIPSDVKNGEDIFEKLQNVVDHNDTTDPPLIPPIHKHERYFPYLDGHTTCFTKSQGTTTIGDGNVAAVNTSANTNEFSIGTPNNTGGELLQTEVAFTVVQDGETKTILSKTINENYSDQAAFGDTQTVGVDTDSGDLKGEADNSVTTGDFQFDWDGTPSTKKDLTLSQNNKPLNIPNNTSFRVSHKITVESGTTFTVQPGASVEIASGGSIVVESGATVNVETGGKIKNEGRIENDGAIENFGTIINNFGIIDNGGTITNNGTITNDAPIIAIAITNSGKITNNGTITSYSIIKNNKDGTITNNFLGTIINYGEIYNDDTITNDGTITDDGTIENKKGGTITNKGSITNFFDIIYNNGTINNNGTITNDRIIINSGLIINNGKICNTINGEITGDGTITGNPPGKNC